MFQHSIQPKDIWSIPNLLSLLRLALIPFVLYYYLQGEVTVAGVALIISALTDAADGYIARRFNQITALGKILDPVADKLTQFCVAAGLCFTYKALIPLALVLAIKELLMGLMGLTVLKSGKQPFSARWWGKLATIAFYVAAIAIMLFGQSFSKGSLWGISLTVVLLLAYSLFRYYHMLKSQLRGK
jgi:cardiolipin synthase